MDNQNTHAKDVGTRPHAFVLILVLMDNQNTLCALRWGKSTAVLILVLMDNQNTINHIDADSIFAS